VASKYCPAVGRQRDADPTLLNKARTMVDLGPQRYGRTVWSSAGRGHIEVRGLEDENGTDRRVLGDAVQSALGRVQGVRWAEVNAVTGHVLVLFDQRSVRMSDLVETVATVEEAQGTADVGWSRASPPHPADATALEGALIALAADCIGLWAAAIGRLLGIRPVPPAARALIGIIEAQPRLRRLIETGVGPAGTDVLIGVGSGILQGLSGGIGPLLVTAVAHSQLVAEVRSRRAVWKRREPELCSQQGALPQHPPVKIDRPIPFPTGPVEVFADRVAAGSLLVAGYVLAVTRNLNRTAALLLVGVPPAARLGREAFAATLARHLAGQGVVPMDPGAFRRLDRISAVVVDQRVLGHGDAPSEASSAAHPVASIAPQFLQAFEELATRGILILPFEPEGQSPHASGNAPADAVRQLQAAGHGVLAVAGDSDALAAADIAITVHPREVPTGWTADLICGSDLGPVLTLLHAVPVAKQVSQRAVVIAALGSAAATVLTTLSPLATSDLTMQPVYLSGLITQLDGARTAASLARTYAAHRTDARPRQHPGIGAGAS
jgi:hypothetical protein